MEERPQTGRRGFYGNFFYFVSVLWLTDNAVAAARINAAVLKADFPELIDTFGPNKMVDMCL